MAIVYRTDGPWGTGQGSNLAPAQVDGNFYDIDGRVTTIEDNPVEPIAPIAINIEGGLFTMGLSDGSTLGPIVMTYPMPTWRGNWAPSVAYNEIDFFIAPDGGLGTVMIPHTSAATFDWGALDTVSGDPVYRQLIGASGTTSGIADLVDVALGSQVDNDMLVWDGPASLWRNETPAAITANLPAFGGSTGSVAGIKGTVPAPAAGDSTAGKFLSAAGGWAVPASGGGGTGDVTGPSSSGSGNVATFSGTTGKIIQDSSASIADLKKEAIQVAVSDEATALTTGLAKLTFRMPWALTLTAVRSSLSTASSSGLVTVDIKEGGASILSTALSIDATEKTSTTAATAAAISDVALADDAEITIDISAAGTGAKGLKVTLIGTRA